MKKLINSLLLGMLSCTALAGEPNFIKNIGWLSFRDLSSQSFADKFDQYKKDYIMIDFDAYETSSGLKYSMVWEKNTTDRPWAEYRNMTSDEYHAKWEDFKTKGYRPVDIECYRSGGSMRYGGIWIKNTEGYGWSSKRDMTKAQYESYITEQKAEGRKMIDLEMYATSNGIRYAAVWVKNYDNTDWKEEHGLNRDDYQAKLDDLTGKGYLVSNFDSYTDGSTQRYAFTCEKKSGFAFQVRTDRNETDYANLWREYCDKGYRLIDFECYSTPNGMRYGGVWIENNKRFDYSKKENLDKLINKYKEDNNLPGISVAIVKDGEMVYRRGFGYADKGNGKVAHGETIYLSASVSKLFSGTLAVKLQDEGKLRNGTSVSLNLNNKISSYLTNVKKSDGTTVSIPSKHTQTVAQLYAHIGCIQHYDGGSPSIKQYTKAIDALTQIWNASLVSNCTIGTNYNYSTHAHTYLAAILEKVTGRTAAQLVQSEFADPYGLSTLRAQYSSPSIPADYDRAVPYKDNNTSTSYENNSWKIFGGGIEISAVDLAWFGWKVLDGQIVKPTARDNVMWTRVNSNVNTGIAWFLGSHGSRRIAEHNGSWTGARSELRVYRDDGVVISIMSNRTNHSIDDVGVLADKIGNIVL